MARKRKDSSEAVPAHWAAHLAAHPEVVVFSEAHNALERGNLHRAIRLFQRSAEMGCVQATAWLGSIYDDYLKPPRPDLAVRWYKRGVRHGYEIAAQNLAMHYKLLGKMRWYRYWLKRAVELGHEDSRAELESLT